MRIAFFLFTGLVLLLTVGCSRKIATSTSTSVKDSTFSEVTERKVEVRLPGDTVEVTRWIECDKVTNKPKALDYAKKSGRLKLRLDLSAQGELNISCSEDSLKTVIQAMDKTIFHLKHEVTKTKDVVQVFKTRRIDIICRWIAAIAVLLALVKLYFKFIKPF